MDKLKNSVMSQARSKSRLAKSPPRPKPTATSAEKCSRCMPLDLEMIKGAWTQIYGNPDVLKKKYTTIMSLEDMDSPSGRGKVSNRKVVCTGFEVGKPRRRFAALNYFFRDNGSGNELHEMKGDMTLDENKHAFLDTDLFHSKMCLVKAGPSEVDRYEYIVLTETSGQNACRSYHVYARNTDEFNRRHFDDIAEFMKAEIRDFDALPMAALPMASACELNRPS